MTTQKLSRAQILTAGFFVLFAIFVFQLFTIQILRHEKYSAIADQMQISKRTINPRRGQIFTRDQSGKIAPLVLNQTVYTVFADPSQVTNYAKIRDTVTKIAGDQMLPDNLTKERLTNWENQFLVLARQVTNTQMQTIREENLRGVGFQASSRRVYPEGNLAAQVLGFVNVDGYGQYGIEQFFNEELSGTPGLLQAVTDVRQIPLTIGAHDIYIPTEDGTDYILTIDRSIQSAAEDFLRQGMEVAGVDSGSILVMDPRNGQVLAMADYPTFNPAEYHEVTNIRAFQNSIVSYAFEPGSTMKVMMTGVSLSQEAIRPDTTFRNTGCVQIDDARICNFSRQVDGRTMTMTEVLQWSLNTGTIWQLQQLGGGEITRRARDIMFEYYSERFRFDRPTGIEQPNEASGLMQPPNTPHGARVTYANMTFGQGSSMTMMQFTSAFAAMMNGGTFFQPTLIYGTFDENGRVALNEPRIVRENVLSKRASSDLMQMIYESRRMNRPNAYHGYFTGAKTGTAQVFDPATGRYSETHTIGTAIGFGADRDRTARYVIMVRLDGYEQRNNITAGVFAINIFDNLANFMNQYKGISR